MWQWRMAIFCVGFAVATTAVISVERYLGPSVPDGELVVEPRVLEVDVNQPSTDPSQQQVFLKNIGGKPVTILRMQTSCSCTIISGLNESVVPPNAKVLLPFRVNPPSIGTQKSKITIATDSKITPTVIARVVVKSTEPSTPYLVTAPTEVRISGTGTTAAGEFVVSTVEDKTRDPLLNCLPDRYGKALTLLGVEEATGISDSSVRRNYRFLAEGSIDASHRLEAFRIALPSELLIEHESNRTIRIVLAFQSEVETLPERLTIELSKTENPIFQHLIFKVAKVPHSLDIKLIETLPGITLSNSEYFRKDSKIAARLTMKFDPNELGGISETVLRFKTGETLCPDVSVPIKFSRRTVESTVPSDQGPE
jgi:hypothetical protein